ncbi:MAG: carboxypeptidase regulatory-like domain-containing protein [Pyrinomonadaceae bacterium]|nr:carboxypeptidase regulatory-like domain-containing protein [Pyrinomonadaceae bacterium]
MSLPLATKTQAKTISKKERNAFGVIRGVVRDENGKGIAKSVIAIFHATTSKMMKKIQSSSDGSFMAKLMPGTYTVVALAEGFNSDVATNVQVNRSTEISYGFKLEKSGSGNTLAEKKNDRNSTKWRIRAAQKSRSIYQNQETKQPIEETISANVEEETEIKRKSQSIVETYFATNGKENYQSVNFATLQPLGENAEIVIAGQTEISKVAPQRLETTVKFRPNQKNQIRASASVAKIGRVNNKELGQLSFQASNEFKIKDGVVFVYGLDYSRFIGAGNDDSFNPRLGFQFDVDSKTRVTTSFTTQTQESSWSKAIELEDTSVVFREPVSSQNIAVSDEQKPVMSKARRLEFGIERVLDNRSNIEATAFFDTVVGRGIGLVNLPINFLDSQEFTTTQNGNTQGVRVVYTRRINKTFTASAGYAFGKGQKLSDEAISNPANALKNTYFQTLVGQINANLSGGTKVNTIFRFSPQATIFAIDPFQGRLAIYDPSLSVIVTHPLPNLGLPFRATATIDARNLFEFQTGVNGELGSIKLNTQNRVLRGGISVKF